MIWPSQRLNDNNRYIVALRNLHDNSGKLMKPSNAFLALRSVKLTLQTTHNIYTRVVAACLHYAIVARVLIRTIACDTCMEQQHMCSYPVLFSDQRHFQVIPILILSSGYISR